uniref:dolichyl-diphosphooligosaccharide--protein glycotransferase n=1 Tax=Glossina palpalis gambiensis TaxID=67801 RepID=A0A1B0C5I7_9MUSC
MKDDQLYDALITLKLKQGYLKDENAAACNLWLDRGVVLWVVSPRYFLEFIAYNADVTPAFIKSSIKEKDSFVTLQQQLIGGKTEKNIDEEEDHVDNEDKAGSCISIYSSCRSYNDGSYCSMEWTLLFSRGTGYHKIHIPIIDAVSEHQPTTWFSFFFNLDILVCSFPVSVWYCINKINDIRVFVFMQLVQCILRLMLTITPVVCMLAGFSTLLDVYLREDNTKPNTTLTEDEENSTEKKTLYDKAGKLKHRPKHDAQQHETGTGIGSNLKTFVILELMEQVGQEDKYIMEVMGSISTMLTKIREHFLFDAIGRILMLDESVGDIADG